jgi:hypothetical protein
MGNVHALTSEEVNEYNDRYTIVLDKKYLIVKTNGKNLMLAHSLKEKFVVTFGDSKNGYKKMTITPEASKLWARNYQGIHTLFEIQNAINTLRIIGSEINEESIENYFKKGA